MEDGERAGGWIRVKQRAHACEKTIMKPWLSVKRKKTLLFISLNLNEIKHFLICLLAICISSVHCLYSLLTFTVPKGLCQSIGWFKTGGEVQWYWTSVRHVNYSVKVTVRTLACDTLLLMLSCLCKIDIG